MWGRPASPRPAGLGIMPSGTDPPLDGLDSLLESVVLCSAISTCFLGRPASPRLVGLALARLGPSCRVMLIQGLLMFLKSVGSWSSSLSLSCELNRLGSCLLILFGCNRVEHLILA